MNKIMVILLLSLTTSAYTQQDMNKAMAEYQKMMNDPKLKKTMQDMGVKMPDAKTISQQYKSAAANTSQKQMNAILGVETVPVKDVARITALPKGIFTDAQMNVFLKNVQTTASTKISAQSKKYADQIYQNVKKQNTGTEYLAWVANGLWMKGYAEIGLELMGRAVAENPSDVDNLNNYAVFLSTLGGEQLALPILQKLNRSYPGNSTLLNNIGQAWFGLGDFTTSKKYLDSAIHFFGMHSQANYTEAIIEDAKGNKEGAIDYLKKSLQNGYSPAKAKKLDKLQKGINNGDIAWNFPKNADALGLQKLVVQRPPIYFSVSDGKIQHPVWAAFEEACLKKLLEMREELEKRVAEVNKSMLNQSGGNSINVPGMGSVSIGGGNASSVNNFISEKALQLLWAIDREEADFTQRMEAKASKLCESMTADRTQVLLKIDTINQKYTKERQEKEEADGNKYDEYEGDDRHSKQLLKTYNEKACQEAVKLANEYYLHYNRIISDLSTEWVNRAMYYTNESVYYSRYAKQNDNEYQIAKLGAIISFINVIGRSIYTTPVYLYDFSCKEEKEKEVSMKLQDYDEIHCDNHVSLSVPGIGTSNWDCNIETDNINLGGIVSVKYREDLSNGKFNLHGELGYSKSIGSKSAGPVKVSVSAGGGGFIEATEKGVSDWGVIVHTEAKVGAGGDIKMGTGSSGQEDTQSVGKSTTAAGVEVRVGWNSGPSLEGKGVLSGVSIK